MDPIISVLSPGGRTVLVGRLRFLIASSLMFICLSLIFRIVVEGELNETKKQEMEKMREQLQQQEQHLAELRHQLDSQTALADGQQAKITELSQEARLMQYRSC